MKNILALLGIIGLLIALFAGAIWAGSRMIDSKANSETQTSQNTTTEEELPHLGTFPPIEGIASWINSEELSSESLKGKVVLIDFWTYSCINCIRTFPYLRDWWEKYEDDGLVIIGVHAPEFEFEKSRENVLIAAEKYGLAYPIALDNDFVTWKNFRNQYWPAEYLFDQSGELRYFHFGEGHYNETERAIQTLLNVKAEMTEEDLPNFAGIKSPETYFGWWRAERFASPEGIVTDLTTDYSFPDSNRSNEWALEGAWTINEKYSEANSSGARFRFTYNASIANLVMATRDGVIQDVVVRLDGEVVSPDLLGTNLVVDELTEQTFVQVEFSQLYELIDGDPAVHTLEIETLEPGLQIYAITFG
ncbi:redoxin domain-containing protein [Candidatus Uhrbacteria bacterium]|nr:redoxin domain-containing protein [Candidatus Uhrbacteria bacterium]